MDRKITLNIAVISSILMILATSYTFSHKHHFATIPPYAQKDTLNDPVLFAEGVITTKDDEFGGTFSPDGKTCYFSKSVLRFYLDIICYSQFKNGKWQTPEVAPFSGQYRDFDPNLSADGTKMVFTSNRPVNGELKSDYDIWMVKKTQNGEWSEPIHLDSAINSKYDEHFASIASSGTIYFSSNRPGALGGEGDADFYCSKLVHGHYAKAEHLLDSVSTPSYELDCVVAPDESFLLLGAYGRKDGYGNFDIYISEKVNGKWTASRNLGPKINSTFRDYSPRISPDGKYLFFTSEKDFSAGASKGLSNYKELKQNFNSILNGSGNIYQIELSSIGIKQPKITVRSEE
jgi:WD40-like Beta Propeller Repeat